MTDRHSATRGSSLPRLGLIAAVVAGVAVAFAYTAGWLTPERLTPAKIVNC